MKPLTFRIVRMVAWVQREESAIVKSSAVGRDLSSFVALVPSNFAIIVK